MPDLAKRLQNTGQAGAKPPHLFAKRPEWPKKVLWKPVRTPTEAGPKFPFYNIKSVTQPLAAEISRILQGVAQELQGVAQECPLYVVGRQI